MIGPIAHLGLRDGDRFLAAYREAFGSIHGAFTIDAALLFFAYGALLAEDGVRGSVLEIGVHHGLSAIAVAALRGPGARMVGIDTFGTSRDVVASGGMSADERTFRANMSRFYTDSTFLRVIAADSRTLTAADLGGGFSFGHIDGGHSAEETYHDLSLAGDATMPGGLIALDDYFNPTFPGVSEGTMRYLIEHPGALVPLAIGCNKLIFRRGARASDLSARIARRYPFIPRTHAVFMGERVLVFGSGVAKYMDVDASTVTRLVPRETVLRVDLEPQSSSLDAAPGATAALPVRVRNRSNVPLEWSDSPFGLSYHVSRSDGTSERYENARLWFIPSLGEGEERVMTVGVIAPDRSGDYVVEVDVVWEGVCWLRERGNVPPHIALRVS